MTKLFLSLSNIDVRSQNSLLFKNLNLAIDRGQNWALTGESGSGKTALLQTIAGKLAVTAGKITYHFYDLWLKNNDLAVADIRLQQLIASVEARHHFRNLSNTTDFYYQQRYNAADANNALTVSDYLLSVNACLKTDLLWTFDRVVNSLKLKALINKQVIKLSNGESKRLIIAAALLKNPVLLLLDNPLTGLDVETRQHFNELISEIAASGITIIMATSAQEIPDAITHVAALKNGRIEQTLTRAQLKEALIDAPKDIIDDGKLFQLMSNEACEQYDFIVKMNQVNISYNQVAILKDIDWEIKQGERWALLGSNGAGKSTLLSLINGDNPQAYANDIVLFDRKRGTGESIWDIKRKIGFVSPELHQYFPSDNSCLQVVESGFYDTLGLFKPSQKQKVDIALQWMKALEIDRYACNLLKNIPASAQRLCLLARALVKNPVLLIFDEPCQGMDDHQLLHFKNIIDAVCKTSNFTLIYVTHYPHEIPGSVDKILRLEKGNIIS